MKIESLAPGNPRHEAMTEAIELIERAGAIWLDETGDNVNRRLMLIAAAIFYAGAQSGMIASVNADDDPDRGLAAMIRAARQNFLDGIEAGKVAMGLIIGRPN